MSQEPEQLKGLPVPLSVVDDSERREQLWAIGKLRRDDQQTVFWLVVGLVFCVVIWLAFYECGPKNIRQNHDDSSRELNFLVDLNNARESEVLQLPGIGPTLAARIVEHREDIAPFEDAADLQKIRGIGPKKLAAISPYIHISK